MKTLLNKGNLKEHFLLVAVWGTVIVTGFLALGAIVGNIEGLIVFGMIHSLAVRLGSIYTAVHIFRRREQIMSRFGIKIGRNKQAEKVEIEPRSLKNNRVVKVVAAIVFHICLHIVSVHLAAAYTIVHIVQHRREIISLPKKLSSRNSGRSLQLARSAQPIQLAA